MESAINWKDTYFASKDRIVLTNNEVRVPGDRVLAHHLMNSSIAPLQAHYHEDCFEFTLIYDGSFIFQAQGQNYKASGSDIFIAYPNEVHSTNQFPLSHGEFYWLQLDCRTDKGFLFLEKPAADDLIQRLQNIRRHLVKLDTDEPFSYLRQAFQLAVNGVSPYLIAGYLVLFLNLLSNDSVRQQPVSKEIYQALNYIFDHIETDISMEQLAACSNLSVPQFKVKFKKEMGVSPRSFVNTQKIEVAKQLLLEGMSKTDVALQLGFNTSSYFAAVFKKYTFSTPSEYVKNNGAT